MLYLATGSSFAELQYGYKIGKSTISGIIKQDKTRQGGKLVKKGFTPQKLYKNEYKNICPGSTKFEKQQKTETYDRTLDREYEDTSQSTRTIPSCRLEPHYDAKVLDLNPSFANGSRIYNLDETSTTTVQRPHKVLAAKGRSVCKSSSFMFRLWGLIIIPPNENSRSTGAELGKQTTNSCNAIINKPSYVAISASVQNCEGTQDLQAQASSSTLLTLTPKRDKNLKRKYTEESVMSSSNASTPRKRKLQKIIVNKECLIKKQRLKIRRIQAQNRRLKKKFNKMQDVLNDLQKKFSLQDEDISVLKNLNVKIQELTNRMIAKSTGGGPSKQKYSPALHKDGNTIEWRFLEQLNNLQMKEGFHLANKLRYHHVHFQNNKMKVKLATQLFSLSVADAIDFCRDQLNLPSFKNSESTTFFLRIINNMFDIFNSRNTYEYNFKKALTESNAAMLLNYLDMATTYLSELRTEEGTLLTKSLRYIAHILIKKIDCDICIGALLSNSINEDHKFIVAKDKGESVIKIYTENLRNINKKMLMAKIMRHFVGSEIFKNIIYHQIGQYPTANHVTDLTKAIVEKYINLQAQVTTQASVAHQRNLELELRIWDIKSNTITGRNFLLSDVTAVWMHGQVTINKWKQRVALTTLTNNDEICVPCYLRAQRVLGSSQRSSTLVTPSTFRQSDTQPEQQTEVVPSTSRNLIDETSAEQISPATFTDDTAEDEEVTSAEQITLPTLRRAADTARRCMFLESNDSEKRQETQLDFQNPQSIDDHLFKYWFGRTKPEFNEVLVEEPQLNDGKMKNGFSALLCKMRTGGSDERITALFQIQEGLSRII
ncbi:hypothetical protein HW555_009992 [Spodoptera exigua]|uniref:Transposable element P transposase-like GTP-binding insertion domain-containing protein n=1 Tax=Spodoptera exigua TaxID=7107 RepID=A0A835L300_SPOEX|nr:hypothetical protein HW555_009992 [Spodoptera exigua]